MRIVYLGSGAFGCASLRWLVAEGYSVPLVVTQPARPSGRGRKTLSTPISQLAESELGLRCIESSDINAMETITLIREIKPDVILIIAFGQRIGPEILSLPDTHAINLHASLLPKYRGAAPINWAIINGETESGLTIFSLTKAWDAGAIWGSLPVVIEPNETASDLHDRLAQQGPKLIDEVLKKISEGTTAPQLQDNQLATRAPKLKKSDGAIAWSKPAPTVHNLIRGMWSWPGAYCHIEQESRKLQRITIAKAELSDNAITDHVRPGTILDSLHVVCGNGECLNILQVKPDNSRLMSFRDFVNGHQIRPGDLIQDG